MKIIKRSGMEVDFDVTKIAAAVRKANNSVVDYEKISEDEIVKLSETIENACSNMQHTPTVEDIQDMVENQLMSMKKFTLARNYITYRYRRELVRKSNTTDDQILSLIECNNEEVKQENSNKNPTVNSVQRDYMAGEVSKDITKRFLLPADIWDAHEKGIIHFHDADYFAQHMHNCCLVNLEDMLQNGTVISGTMIETPKSFSTTCNIATQVVAQIASAQYGGQTIALSHLIPFVDISRKKIRNRIAVNFNKTGVVVTDEKLDKIVEAELDEEISRGVQMIQYQLITLMTTNGQAPFVSIFMNIGDCKSEQEKADFVKVSAEIFNQRIKGVKNEKGIYVTPAFPKLLYVLDECNVHEDSPYFWLTQLAAKCTAKRMVPDYISAKQMRELKDGNVYGCMGCVDGKELITYKMNNQLYVESFERAWRRLSDHFEVKHQFTADNPNLYMDLKDVLIYDTKKGFVNTSRIIRNVSDEWIDLGLTNGRHLYCTSDHPLTLTNGRTCHAIDLKTGDEVAINTSQYSEETVTFNTNKAWLLGFMLCDGSYQNGHLFSSIAATGEDEIETKVKETTKDCFELDVKTVLQQRDRKGTYKDLCAIPNEHNGIVAAINELTTKFGGIIKEHRHVPNEVFSWNREAKLAFLAGMIDADDYINHHETRSAVQIGSTNKELALGQMALAQALGMPARVYHNHYNKRNSELIRYRVEFYPTDELVSYIACQKKRDNYVAFDIDARRETATVSKINVIKKTMYSYDVTTDSEHFEVSGIYSHNCRSFLTVDRYSETVGNISKAKNFDEHKGHVYFGRFNQGVVTLNLVDVACSSGRDMDKFWKILDERLELCHRALRCRHERLLGTKSDVAPILWQHGGLARLGKGEVIDPLLFNGYSTISLGYAGLCEMCRYMLGKSHTDPSATPFALKVMQKLNDACNKWKAAENIDYSIYGTPLESTTYKFAKCLQKRFGIIEGVTDKNYITNSYHVHVTEQINAFDKLKFESQFQKLSPGGAISYVEVPDMQTNIPAVVAVIQYIYDNIMYAELNTKSDYCEVCGYDGEIKVVEDEKSHKLVWECPHCGNRDQNKMSVARRTCGYIGTQFWNQGRTQEIKERVLHL